jgi:hypothetical protein
LTAQSFGLGLYHFFIDALACGWVIEEEIDHVDAIAMCFDKCCYSSNVELISVVRNLSTLGLCAAGTMVALTEDEAQRCQQLNNKSLHAELLTG